MKIKSNVLFAFIVFCKLSFAQIDQYPMPNNGDLVGGFGLNWIAGEPHYTFHLRPDIAFKNFGVGLDLQLDFDKSGKLRTENFNEFSDYLSVIRYVRYGEKEDPLFIKLGALDYYTLGHGSIMYQYNNSPTFDARRTGLILDVDFGNIGLESIYSSFAQRGVIGIRAYSRPLKFTSAANIPILSNIEVGASFVSDFNEYAGIISGNFSMADNKFLPAQDNGSMNVMGFDIGLPVISTSALDINLYADYVKFFDFGHGFTSGIIFNFNGLGLAKVTAKFERRFNNDQYLPSYFNSLYEVQRFQANTQNPSAGFKSKAAVLASTVSTSNGYYGELGVRLLGTFDVLGSFQKLDKDPDSGILHLWTQITPETAPVVVRAGYDKVNIKDGGDLFKLDDRSYLYTEFGYKPATYLLVSIVYNWTFTPVRDFEDNIIDYKSQKRIEPRISFIYPFSFGE